MMQRMIIVVEVVARHGGAGTVAPETHMLGEIWGGLVVDDPTLFAPLRWSWFEYPAP